ncbi:hypothetical protein QMA51_05565 [Leuconostoc suionicum]|uniref:hypothetical protein n=1 Tax=Leuconostoc suionicum TaxID=1511761 RepID=UPI0024AD6B6C|nr:hypothetical protein [Leuconostoc suionicum]MDI6551120.1 hypothetical protein [Leuconostoc suionicum]
MNTTLSPQEVSLVRQAMWDVMANEYAGTIWPGYSKNLYDLFFKLEKYDPEDKGTPRDYFDTFMCG